MTNCTSKPHWRDALLILALSPAIIGLCYSAQFLEFDDAVHYNHELVLPDTPLSGVFKPVVNTYFPITVISYRIDHWLFDTVPPQPWLRSTAAIGVRLHSLVLHILAAIFLWRALLLLKFGRWLSLFATAAWAAHPMACESVAWISERKNVLAAFFGFASLWVYFGGVRWPWPRMAATAMLFALAILSKPNAAGFLPIYIIYDVLRCGQSRAESRGLATTAFWPTALPQILLYFTLGAVIVLLAQLNIRMCQGSSVDRVGGSLWAVALTDVPILVEYIHNAIIPASLSIFYFSPEVTSVFSGLFWSRLGVLTVIVCATVWLSPNRWRTLFLWGWFFGALGPSLNLIAIPYLMQDRYAYFSLPALLMIAAESCAQVWSRLPRGDQTPSAALTPLAAIAGAGCFAIMAFFRSAVYRNDLELFSDAVHKQPKSTYAHLFYALTVSGAADVSEYSGKGDPLVIRAAREGALEHLQQSMRCDDFDRMLDPGRVRILQAVLNERLGRPRIAFATLVEEMAKSPKPYNAVIACLSLARIELALGQPLKALDWLNYALKSQPLKQPSAELLYLKGLCYEKLERKDDARAAYRAISTDSLASERALGRLNALK